VLRQKLKWSGTAV